MVALLTQADGSRHRVDITYPTLFTHFHPHHHFTHNSTTFSSSSTTHHPSLSILVMMYCVGFTGRVSFTEVKVKSTLDKLSPGECPPPPPHLPSGGHHQLREDIIVAARSDALSHHQLTIATQLTMDRLSSLMNLLTAYKGPVVAVVYVNSRTSDDHAWRRRYVEKRLAPYIGDGILTVILVVPDADRPSPSYPINTLRNLANQHAGTDFLLNLDVDFLPSPGLEERFAEFWRDEAIHWSETALVVPAFELLDKLDDRDASLPDTREDLLSEIRSDAPNVVPFRYVESPSAHSATDYERWYRAAPGGRPYPVTVFHDRYEPYVIVHRTLSAGVTYNELFTGYGMNKISYVLELRAARYHFLVAPSIWILHQPHRISDQTNEFLLRPMRRLENRALRFEFISHLMRKYKVGRCS